jgi:hypothetical protein
MEVFRRVLVLRGIAAADVAAYQALPQVNPLVSQFYALAADSSWLFHGFNLIQVRALFHNSSHLQTGRCSVSLSRYSIAGKCRFTSGPMRKEYLACPYSVPRGATV